MALECPAGRGTVPGGLRKPLAPAYCFLIGIGGLGWLGYHVLKGAPSPWWPVLAFAGLSAWVQRSSFHLGACQTYRLSGVFDLAAVLALGPVAGAVVAACSGSAYLLLSALHRRRASVRSLFQVPLFDAGLKAMMALACGWLFSVVQGSSSPGAGRWEGMISGSDLGGRVLLAVGAASLLWFLTDRLGWGVLHFLEGGGDGGVPTFLGGLPGAALVELGPLPLSAVIAVVYLDLHWGVFVLLALAVLVFASVVRRWADSREELTRRITELATLEQVGREIAQAQLDVDELCQLLYEQASRVHDTTIFQLGLFEGETYVIQLWVQEGRRVPGGSFPLTPGAGLVRWMRESKQPLLVQDFQREMESLPARPSYVSERPPRSALFVPLTAGETAIGMLSVQSYRPGAYSPSDLRALSAVANQAAVAIQKAQLYAQEQKRARQLDTIGQVARRVSATLELGALFQQTVRLIRESFGYYHVGVFTADRKTQTITFQASASAGQGDVAFDVQWNQGLIGWVAAHQQPAVANDVEADERYRCVDALEETRSEIAVPLCLDDELVGVLDVQSDRPGAFSSDDLFILETLSAQVAIAIQEARLYEAEKEQAWLSTAMLQVTDTLNRLSDMDEVLTAIVRLVPMLAGVERSGVMLWDAEMRAFVPAKSYGLSPEGRRQFECMTLPSGAVPALDLIQVDPMPIAVRPPQASGLVPPALMTAFQASEMVLLPLVAQGELLGVLLAGYSLEEAGPAQPTGMQQRRGTHLGEQLMAMLGAIASQASMVIQNARLLQAQREEAYVSMALLQVADAVSHSTNLKEALSSVVRIAPILVGVEACAILLEDRTTGAFLPYSEWGLPHAAEEAFWQIQLSPSDPPARQLLAGAPVVLGDELAPLAGVASEWDLASSLILPISTRGELVGMMAVRQGTPVRRLSERRLAILTGIAAQAAIAVENSRLLEEAAEQERMKKELEVARRIQSSFLPEGCPDLPGWDLAAAWRSAREVAGDFYDFIPIVAQPPGDTRGDEGASPAPAVRRPSSLGQPMGVVIADVADKGVPAALFMALSRTLLRTMAIGGTSPATVIRQANNLILADTRAELFVTLFYAILDPASGEVVYANAGHLPAILVRAVDGEVDLLRTGDIAMGVLADMDYHEMRAVLGPADTLVLYTDGVVEAFSPEHGMFGRERLIEVIRRHRHESAGQLVERIEAAVGAFVGEAPQLDDLTLVVAKRIA